MSIKKHIKICEIMEEEKVCYAIAELIFITEICDKYNTSDIDLALAMFNAEP